MRGLDGGGTGVRNVSHQQLMGADVEGDSDGVESITVPSSSGSGRGSLSSATPKGFSSVTATEWCCVIVLCYVNLINYMDRYTMAGIIKDIQTEYELNDKQAGLLQTVFVISYMIFAPIFGYLGDRYSRKTIMAFGVFLWSLTTLAGSFMQTYGWFLLLRACVGIGEASYSTIAPTIISDLFIKDLRAKMLAMFYFAIPVGSGLGYIVGAKTAAATGVWQYALRVTPAMGALAVVLIMVVIKEPDRGHSEGRTHLTHTSWAQDLQYLTRNRSFMLSTGGFMCVSFVAGALAWWGPIFITRGVQLQPGGAGITDDDVAFTFGLMTMLAGLVGVPLGSFLSQSLRGVRGWADPVICGCGLLVCAPLFLAAMLVVSEHTLIAYTLVFFAQLALNLNWAIVADILLYVVVPTRRSTAEAFQILISHAFGDAGSPYLIGAMTDWLGETMKGSTKSVAFYSLQYSLFTTCFIELVGGAFFLVTALYIVKDRLLAERSVKGIENDEPCNIFADEAHQSRSGSVSC